MGNKSENCSLVHFMFVCLYTYTFLLTFMHVWSFLKCKVTTWLSQMMMIIMMTTLFSGKNLRNCHWNQFPFSCKLIGLPDKISDNVKIFWNFYAFGLFQCFELYWSLLHFGSYRPFWILLELLGTYIYISTFQIVLEIFGAFRRFQNPLDLFKNLKVSVSLVWK